MNNLWNYIAGLNLSSHNQAWLGERLIEAAKRTREQEVLKPYTREELLERVERGRRQIAEGRSYSTAEVLGFCGYTEDEFEYSASEGMQEELA